MRLFSLTSSPSGAVNDRPVGRGDLEMSRVAVVLLVGAVLAGCAGASSSSSPSQNLTLNPSPSSPASALPAPGASVQPVPMPNVGLTPQGAKFTALANALNRSMASIPNPSRSLEELTASYGMQAAIMARYSEGLAAIGWPAQTQAHAWAFLTIAREVEFYDAALSRAPSMDVLESLESSRDAATAGWQQAIDDLTRDVGTGPIWTPAP